jgi:hypothetical protein
MNPARWLAKSSCEDVGQDRFYAHGFHTSENHEQKNTLISPSGSLPWFDKRYKVRKRCHKLSGGALTQAESATICARRDTGVPLEQLPKESQILVTHGVANLLHSAMITLQQSLGR